jgi:LysM repeat protein
MLVWVASLNIAFAAESPQASFIKQYKNIAIKEMERTGIPASIKIAQALLESGAGRSDLARKANNHFGIKCGGDWTGKTYYKEDDDRDARGRIIPSCFRKYNKAEESWIAHSEFLSGRYRYQALFQLDPKDYKAWAHGLRQAGYATNPNYANDLIRVIETYQLYQYDEVRVNVPSIMVNLPEKNKETPVSVNAEITTFNDARITFALGNETLQDIAKRTNLSTSILMRYNDARFTENSKLPKGTKVYLQPKRSTYRGKESFHEVMQGETMLDISHQYGVHLEQLYRRNLMPAGTQPATGERILLRGRHRGDTPRLATDAAIKKEIPKPRLENEADIFQDTDLNDDENVVSITELTIPSFEPPTSIVKEEDVSNRVIEDLELATTGLFHEVKAGETLYRISVNYGVSVEQLRTLNQISGNTISIGQRLRIR